MNEGLAQGPYVAARVGFEPATYQTEGTEPTTEPLRMYAPPYMQTYIVLHAHMLTYVHYDNNRGDMMVVFCNGDENVDAMWWCNAADDNRLFATEQVRAYPS